MEHPDVFKEFARYTALSVFGTLGVSCYILADTFFVAKGLGADGLTALNLAVPVYNFIHGTGLMLGMGGATKFTVLKAQGNQRETNRVFQNTLFLAFLFSAMFFVMGLFLSEPLSVLLGADADVLTMTDTYLRWMLLFAPAFILNDVYLCFIRNDNAPKLSMIAMLVGSLSNIILDYVFIFPMGMGIFGAIFATGLSPVISLLMMSPHWLKRKNTFHFASVPPDLRLSGQELSLGFPSLLAQLSSGITMITFNAIILKLNGNTGVAAYGVVANISLVVVAVYTGIAQGVQPLISGAYGQNNDRRIQLVMKYSMATMAVSAVLLYALLFVFAGPTASVFNSGNDAGLQQIAVSGLKLYFTSTLFVGYNILLANYFTSVEQALPAHILSFLRGLLLIIPMAFLLSYLLGMTGIWLSYPVTEGLVAALGFVFLRSFRRRQR